MRRDKYDEIKASPKEIVDAMMRELRPSPYFDSDFQESDHESWSGQEYSASDWAYEEFEDQINDFIIGSYTDGGRVPRLKKLGDRVTFGLSGWIEMIYKEKGQVISASNAKEMDPLFPERWGCYSDGGGGGTENEFFWRERWDPQDPESLESWPYPVSKEDIETFKERGYFIPPSEELEYRGACILTVEAYLLGFESSNTGFLIVRPRLDYYTEASAIDSGDDPEESGCCFNIWDIENESYDPANDMHGYWDEIYDEVTSDSYGILTKL